MVKPKPFPSGGDPESNPAIQLFGLRFVADQTVPELLLELLLVATSAKRISGNVLDQSALLPEINLLRSWPDRIPLEYAPKSRLNLKLFAFLGASKLDTRHESHRHHYRELIKLMVQPQKLGVSGATDANEILKTLENLFLGFQSVGGQRTWCAVSFLPVARQLIAKESIWQETKANKKGVSGWESALPFFSHNQHIFLARGGELLYLQLCNALRQDPSLVRSWMVEAGLSPAATESEPDKLHHALTRALALVLDGCPSTVGKLAEFLDSRIDPKTAEFTDLEDSSPRFAKCGWCPEESWREGILFAVELLRLCEAVVDPIEQLELLEMACALQLLRSLCAQSARYITRETDTNSGAGPLRYSWAISDPAGSHTAVKQISRRNVNAVQRMIYDALRHPSIRESGSFASMDEAGVAAAYKEADSRYGHKLFLAVAKRIGLIVPKRGAGARFVLNEKLLRCLVLATVRPGNRVTYDSFKKLIFAHYGIAVDDEAIGRSCLWSGTSRTTLGGNADGWLTEMLDASGMLIRLSDSCSLVRNPFDGGERHA